LFSFILFGKFIFIFVIEVVLLYPVTFILI